ncbi:MAG: hypothetical protein HY443_01615 [Candidatus Nealsonbacteria bacterium]|nr:hypothetical protein [Candidatus Nealsonbacteria bacterium]
MANRILLSITTTNNNDWRARLQEAKELGVKELALFPTCLDFEDRQALYSALPEFSIENIPFCHLRSDMGVEELDFLVKNYHTKAFNTHMEIEYPRVRDWSKYQKIIFIEFVYHKLDEKELKEFGGICLDISHLEDDRLLHRENYEHNLKVLEKYPIGCNHISAVRKLSRVDEVGQERFDFHRLDDLSELDYLRGYPEKYFSPLCAIELENSIPEQLKVRDYINKIILEK